MSKACLSAVCCLLSVLALSANAAFIKVPPPVYAGLVKDYMQNPYPAANEVQVFARRASDAKLLAATTVGDVAQGVNYSLTLPMLSAASADVVGLQYGETATFSCLDGDVLWSNLARVTPSKPGFQRLDFTLGHDENGDGIADEYAAYMELKMKEYEIAGAYDPEADYNGDGISNRAHYLAATNPFAGLVVGGQKISECVCTISSLMNVRSVTGDEFFAITFNALEEVAYSVYALDDLSKGWGEAVKVASRETKNGESEEDHYPEQSGEMTLYVPKGSAKQMFYKLSIEE